MFDRTIETDGLKDYASKNAIGIITFCPLAQGLLTDRYLHGIPQDSRIRTDGRFLKENAITEETLAKINALNEIAKKVLAAGCMKLGLIEKEDEIDTYYMHGVSHHLGIDVHDVNTLENDKLLPGMVISDEPGLYIDEWEIGIRIEDDLLITEDGCEVLSEQIIRDPDEIEGFMQNR